MRRSLSILYLAAVLLLLAACRPTPTPTPQPSTATPVPPTATAVPIEPTPESPTVTGDLLDVLDATGQHALLVQAIEDADLTEKLQSEGPYTLFAPTDAAFAAEDAVLLDDPDLLFDILLYHVVEQALSADEAAAQGSVTSLLGDELTLSADGDRVRVNDAVVSQADVIAENGVVHTVDVVLIPPSLGE